MGNSIAISIGGFVFAMLPLILLIIFIGWFVSKLNLIEHRLESIDRSLKQIAERSNDHSN